MSRCRIERQRHLTDQTLHKRYLDRLCERIELNDDAVNATNTASWDINGIYPPLALTLCMQLPGTQLQMTPFNGAKMKMAQLDGNGCSFSPDAFHRNHFKCITTKIATHIDKDFAEWRRFIRHFPVLNGFVLNFHCLLLVNYLHFYAANGSKKWKQQKKGTFAPRSSVSNSSCSRRKASQFTWLELTNFTTKYLIRRLK